MRNELGLCAGRVAKGRLTGSNAGALSAVPSGLKSLGAFACLAFGVFMMLSASAAEGTNSTSPLLTTPMLPDAGPSLLRVVGALALVLGIFLGGVWFYRNGQRFRFRGGRAPRLNVLETRSLGGRHAIYVVGYDQERFLVASTPTGINLLTHLPTAVEEQTSVAVSPALGPSFAEALARVLKAK